MCARGATLPTTDLMIARISCRARPLLDDRLTRPRGDAPGSDNGARSGAAYSSRRLSGRGSQVHSLTRSAPGSHQPPAL